MTKTTKEQEPKKEKGKRWATGKQSAKERERLDEKKPALEFGELDEQKARQGWGRIHLMVDLESRHVGLSEMKSGLVGHTWVSLEPFDPNAEAPQGIPAPQWQLLSAGGKYANPFGMWPDIKGFYGPGRGYSSNIAKSYVQGLVKNPDRAHEGQEKATMSYEVTLRQAQNALKYADSKRSARYSVYHYNCTTFAKEFVQAAGQSAPDVSKGGLAMPDSAYNGILSWAKKGKDGADVKGGVDDNEIHVNDADVGVTFKQTKAPKEIAEYTGKPNFLEVTSVREKGPAEGKLKVGDQVIYIQGRRCNSEVTLKRSLFGKFGQDFEFTVVKQEAMTKFVKALKETTPDQYEDVDQQHDWYDDVVVKAGRPPGLQEGGKKGKTKNTD